MTHFCLYPCRLQLFSSFFCHTEKLFLTLLKYLPCQIHNWKCLKGLEILSERNSYCSELRSIYPTRSKAYLLTLGCGKRKYSTYCRTRSKETDNAEKTRSPRWLLKPTVYVMVVGFLISSWTFFLFVSHEITVMRFGES